MRSCHDFVSKSNKDFPAHTYKPESPPTGSPSTSSATPVDRSSADSIRSSKASARELARQDGSPSSRRRSGGSSLQPFAARDHLRRRGAGVVVGPQRSRPAPGADSRRESRHPQALPGRRPRRRPGRREGRRGHRPPEAAVARAARGRVRGARAGGRGAPAGGASVRPRRRCRGPEGDMRARGRRLRRPALACPVLFRSPPCKPVPQAQRAVCAPGNLAACRTATRCVDGEVMEPTVKPNPYGVIGDRRPQPVVEERSELERPPPRTEDHPFRRRQSPPAMPRLQVG